VQDIFLNLKSVFSDILKQLSDTARYYE